MFFVSRQISNSELSKFKSNFSSPLAQLNLGKCPPILNFRYLLTPDMTISHIIVISDDKLKI